MRAGGCTVQQTLTSEAASVLKHSLNLARRRGHAQVTPLHVAATLLSSRVSPLRRACLKSHPHSSSHPLQCRALELCFNVALNRLPTTPGPLLHGQPSLSNALIAALKRAQAHQRRGCIEQQQQQPLLAIKVELEQLIISILDDPSVSRVMREAGFSSTSVKNNLEDSSPSSVFHCLPSPETLNSSFWQTHFLNSSSEQNPLKEEDLRLVIEVLLRKKRRNTVIIGDSFSTSESLIERLMSKVERGDVPEELRSAHFIKFQFPPVTLRFMKREDVEMKVADLRRKVGGLVSGGGAIIYAGDLRWAVDNEEIQGYSPVEHLVTEIGRLISDYGNSVDSKLWLVATANYQTYMRCQMRQPSLENQWSLQAVSVPSGGLGLSLHASSGLDSRMTLSQTLPQMPETKPFAIKEEQDKLSCCPECTSNFEKDAGFLKSGRPKASNLLVKEADKGSSNLPYWLQPHKIESHDKDDLAELRRKWNRLCHSLHHSRSNQEQTSPFKNYNFASSYSWWPKPSKAYPQSNSISFSEATSRLDQSTEVQFRNRSPYEISLRSGSPSGLSLDYLKSKESKDQKITLALGTSLFTEKGQGEILCKKMQENVPWQSDVIPSVTDALLSSKSNKNSGTWLLVQGDDLIGVRRLARVIAESLYGSTEHLVHLNMRRDNEASEILLSALRKQETCVVLIEEIDYADIQFIEFLWDGSIGGKTRFANATFIVTKGGPSSYENRKESSDNNVVHMKLLVEDSTRSGVIDYEHKRKAEWSFSNSCKAQRTCDRGDISPKKVFSRQSSSNTLDLNIQAEEEEDNEDDEFRSIPSDLTEEATTDNNTLTRFLQSIDHQFVFSSSAAQLDQLTEKFMSRIKGSFEEVFGEERRGSFSVDRLVLEEIVNGGEGILLASMFEKWLKDIFQPSVQMVKKGGKEGSIRLSLGDKNTGLEIGYMGSKLPKTVHVTF